MHFHICQSVGWSGWNVRVTTPAAAFNTRGDGNKKREQPLELISGRNFTSRRACRFGGDPNAAHQIYKLGCRLYSNEAELHLQSASSALTAVLDRKIFTCSAWKTFRAKHSQNGNLLRFPIPSAPWGESTQTLLMRCEFDFSRFQI
jgi:hypothetical protein